MTSPVEKYLNLYAENKNLTDKILGIWSALEIPQIAYPICVPVCCESEAFNFFLKSLIEAVRFIDKPTLLILNLNEKKTAEYEVSKDNEKFRTFLLSQSINFSCDEFCLGKFSDKLFFIAVFAVGKYAFEDDQGVGLARKMAQDLALALYNKNFILSNQVWMSDADVELPYNYLTIQLKPQSSAGVFAFNHHLHPLQPDDFHAKQAAQHYDFSLKYYVAGLGFAGSDYAFDAIGSSIVYHQLSYAQARGLPKLLAAEDFYFLNKLRKLGPIEQVDEIELSLSPRRSERVPFGTGMSVIKQASNLANGNPYLFYNPECFVFLKNWLEYARKALDHFGEATERLRNVFSMSDSTFDFLKNKMLKARAQIELPKYLVARRKAFESFFDGFFQLKLIHILRDFDFQNVNLDTIIKDPRVKKWNYRNQRLIEYDKK